MGLITWSVCGSKNYMNWSWTHLMYVILCRDVFNWKTLGHNKGSNNVAKCRVICTCPYGHCKGHTREYLIREVAILLNVESFLPFHMAMAEPNFLKLKFEDSDACPYQKYYFYVSYWNLQLLSLSFSFLYIFLYQFQIR